MKLVEEKLIGLLVEQISRDGPIPAFRMSRTLTRHGMDTVVRQYQIRLNYKGLPIASFEKRQSDMSRSAAVQQGRVEIRTIGILNVWGAVPLINDRDAVRMTLMTCALDPDDRLACRLIKWEMSQAD